MDQKNFEELENRIGITFKNKENLRRAFVHRSYLNENQKETESNERLEFLGDAVLEFIVSNYLFSKFINQDEGHLTALRSRLVNTTSLAGTARELGLGQLLLMSRGEAQTGRNNPSLLANTVEAIIGAIFVDQGIEAAERFVGKFIIEKVHEIVKESLKDPKSLLQEFVQAKGLPAPVYQVVSQEGPDHARQFTVEVLIDKKSYGQGGGASKKVATQVAAGIALAKWNNSNSS